MLNKLLLPRLIVEVAQTSQVKDKTLKARPYAASGVAEYWLVDVPARNVEVHRGASSGSYASVVMRGSGDELSLAQCQDVAFKVDDLF